MPVYGYLCGCGARFDRYLSYANYDAPQTCECGQVAERQIFAPLMVAVQADVCYDSPIDGRPITSKQARLEDLARNNCRPYDPEMKKDAERHRKEADDKFMTSVDETLDREIAALPSRKLERLQAEVSSGMDAEIVRQGA